MRSSGVVFVTFSDIGDTLFKDVLSLPLVILLSSNIRIHSLVLSMYSNNFSVTKSYIFLATEIIGIQINMFVIEIVSLYNVILFP